MAAASPKGKAPADMHREDIKAAIRKTGLSLAELSVAAGYEAGAVSRALRVPWPSVEAIIAKRIGKRPQDVWPSRYNPDGSPRSSASTAERKRGRRPRHRQIEASPLT